MELEQNPTKPSLFKVVWIFIKTRVIMASIVFFFCLIFGFIGPTCFVRGLISYAEQPPMMGEMPNFSLGLILVLSLLLVNFWFTVSFFNQTAKNFYFTVVDIVVLVFSDCTTLYFWFGCLYLLLIWDLFAWGLLRNKSTTFISANNNRTRDGWSLNEISV